MNRGPRASRTQACEGGEGDPRFATTSGCRRRHSGLPGRGRAGPPSAGECALRRRGQAIRTDTAMVKKAREGVMEFLINQPPDRLPSATRAASVTSRTGDGYVAAFSRVRRTKGATSINHGPGSRLMTGASRHALRPFSEEVAGCRARHAVPRRGTRRSLPSSGVTSEIGNLAELPGRRRYRKPSSRVPAVGAAPRAGDRVRTRSAATSASTSASAR